jgi:hypothetical protein
MRRLLVLERSPPAALSLRFFATAPLFAMLAAALLWWQGAAAFASRWSGAALAITHLLALGVLTMVISGALMQLLPVAAGVEPPWRRRGASVLHALLCGGTLLLAAAFWWSQPVLFALALAALAPALLWMLACCALGLWRGRRQTTGAMAHGVRLALAALLPTVVLGASMAAAFARPLALPLPLSTLTDLHVLWGLAGWIGLLVIAIAYQVIPMFQVTAMYPAPLARVLGRALFALLLAASAAQLAGLPALVAPLRTALAGGFALFAGTTLVLLARRKRAAPDPTSWFWRLAMASLLAIAALWWAPLEARAQPLLLGIVFLFGFALSAVTGMLYKIVPFLLWLDWQKQDLARPVASIRLVIPEPRALIQFWSHALALLMLVGATLWPALLARPAAVAVFGSALLLELNLLRAMRLAPRA